MPSRPGHLQTPMETYYITLRMARAPMVHPVENKTDQVWILHKKRGPNISEKAQNMTSLLLRRREAHTRTTHTGGALRPKRTSLGHGMRSRASHGLPSRATMRNGPPRWRRSCNRWRAMGS